MAGAGQIRALYTWTQGRRDGNLSPLRVLNHYPQG